jgi:hypothetical protein
MKSAAAASLATPAKVAAPAVKPTPAKPTPAKQSRARESAAAADEIAAVAAEQEQLGKSLRVDNPGPKSPMRGLPATRLRVRTPRFD